MPLVIDSTSIIIEDVTDSVVDLDPTAIPPTDMATLNVNLDVAYKLNGCEPEQLRNHLESNIRTAISRGLLVGESPAEVTRFSLDVTEIPYEEVPDEYPDEDDVPVAGA